MFGTIQVLLLLTGLLLAARWGEWPERMAILSMLATLGLDRFYHWLIGGRGIYTHLDPGHLVIDLFLLIALVTIALKADRQWCFWAAASQIVATIAHAVRWVAGDVGSVAYLLMIRQPSWWQIALTFGGIGFVALRRRRAGRRSAPPWLRLPENAPRRSPTG